MGFPSYSILRGLELPYGPTHNPGYLSRNLPKALAEILTSALISCQFAGVTFGCWHIRFWRWQIRNWVEVEPAFPLIWGRNKELSVTTCSQDLRSEGHRWNLERTKEITSSFMSRRLQKSCIYHWSVHWSDIAKWFQLKGLWCSQSASEVGLKYRICIFPQIGPRLSETMLITRAEVRGLLSAGSWGDICSLHF